MLYKEQGKSKTVKNTKGQKIQKVFTKQTNMKLTASHRVIS